MKEAVQTLKRQRVRMMLVNLAHFIVLLILGVLLFLKNAGGGAIGYLLIAACLAGYLLLVRPMSRRYTDAVRAAIIQYAVCGELTDCEHQPKSGTTAEKVRACGLVPPSADTFMSREHVTGRCGTMSVEMADVTFPVIEDGHNAMFNGAFVQLVWPGANFAPITVKAGEWKALKLPKQQMELVEKLGELIPGSLYLKAGGETLTLLLRGRFLGFRVNPLMQIGEQTLGANPFPELGQAIQLARLMRLKQA